MVAAVHQEGNVPKTLRIAEDLALPLETVTQTIAILAIKRSGKSFTAKRLAEQMFKAGLQIVCVDPKGDWWGLRSSADGKGPGLGILILGGEHGDLPLEVGSGEFVAKLVVEERVSVVLDLSLFRKHEVATFMAAFGEGLYRLKAREEFRTPVMVIVDEADAVAPQKPQENEARMLGAWQDIVRRGGQRGIGSTFVTQRSAVLNKDLLTQAQVLIALRTISPQDRKALDAWIEVHGTPEERATLMESIASLPRGTAWVWSPGWPDDRGIFQRVQILPIETFDSGATPKPGERRVEPKKRADVDLEALRRQMAETVERAKAADPTLLRRRVAELERELARKPAAAPHAPPAKVERVEVEVVKPETVKRIEAAIEKADRTAQALVAFGAALRAQLARAIGAPPPPLVRAAPVDRVTIARVAALPPPRLAAGRGRPGATLPPEDAPNLRAGERRILEVLARSRPARRSRAQLGTLSGFTPSGGTFGTYWGVLKRHGLVEEGRDGLASITDAGLAAIGEAADAPPQTREEVIESWRRALRAGERAMLDALLAARDGLTREQLGEQTGFAASGGTFGTYLGVLRRNGLAEVDGDLVRPGEAILSVE
jgi:hypothetical protein